MSSRRIPTTGTGILVGRPVLSKASYEYVIVPRDRSDIDVLVTTLPPELMTERYVINTRMVAEFLRGIYIVDYQWIRKPVGNSVTGGFIDKGIVTHVHGRVDIDIDNPVESLRKIDDTAGYNEIHDVVSVDMNFIRGLIMSASAVTTDIPKRSLSIQVATRVKDDSKTPILMNIAEAYLYLKEHPGNVRGVGILRRYKLPIIVVDEISLDELKERIVYNMNASILAFHNEFSTPPATVSGEL